MSSSPIVYSGATPDSLPAGAAKVNANFATLDSAVATNTAALAAEATARGAGDTANASALTRAAVGLYPMAGVVGKVMSCVGDSTSSNAAPMYGRWTALHQQTGEALAGVSSILNRGSNGCSLAVYLADGVTFGVTQTIAEAADIIIFCFGINDVRNGLTSLAQLIALLKTAIEKLLLALPNTVILLRMPNSLLTTDVGANHFVTAADGTINPAGAAQAYSTILHDAYESFRGKYTRVGVLTTQGPNAVFDLTSPATTSLMADQLHPSASGYAALADLIAPAVSTLVATQSKRNGFSQARADAARVDNPTAPETVYPNIILDPEYYDVVAYGEIVNATLGAGFTDFTWLGIKASAIQKGDLVQIGTGVPFTIPVAATVAASAANTRISGLGGSLPAATVAGGTVTVARPRYRNDANIRSLYNDRATYPYRFPVWIASGGVNFIDLNVLNSNEISILKRHLKTTDTLAVTGQTPKVLTGASFTVSGPNIRVLGITQDFSAWAGGYGWVFGDATHFDETTPYIGNPPIVQNGASGTNKPSGPATLVAGTVTINNTKITASTMIKLTARRGGVVANYGHLFETRVAGTSFTITSSNAADTCSFDYELAEPGV